MLSNHINSNRKTIMTLAELIKLNETFKDLFATAKQANKTLNENNQTIRLLVRNMDDVQNKLHQAIGEATSKGYL